jgi:hypothetical protein
MEDNQEVPLQVPDLPAKGHTVTMGHNCPAQAWGGAHSGHPRERLVIRPVHLSLGHSALASDVGPN